MGYQNQASAQGYGDCPVCLGTGWEIYREPADLYGGKMCEFARRCSRCAGARRSTDVTGVPEQFHDADLTSFDFGAYGYDLSRLKQICQSFFRDFTTWEKSGKGLYLWSKTPGSGKSFLAACLAKSVMMRYNLQMRFVTAPDYLNLVADEYKRERGQVDRSEVYRECSLLVLDDIGAGKDGDWQKQEIFRLVNGRLCAGNVTVYTSNYPPDGLKADARTIDRIVKGSVVLQMPEVSIRQKLARQEQDAFLRRALDE